MLTPELKKAWLEKLRSGKYEQGKYGLRDLNNKFCCLGVYADCLVDAEPSLYKWAPSEFHYRFFANDEHKVGFLQGSLMETSVQSKLSNMNDAEEKTFLEIADYIEENL